MSNLQRMKAAVGSKGPITVPSVTLPEKRPPKVKAEALPGETPASLPPSVVVYRCGHKEPIKSFLSGDCPKCRNKRRQEKAQKKNEARLAKRNAPPTIGEQRFGRLPDKSAFQAVYDASTETWTGTLTINGQTFTATAGGLQKALLSELDRKYRESLAAS